MWTGQHGDVIGYFTGTSTATVGSAAYDPWGTLISAAGHATELGYQGGYTDGNNGSGGTAVLMGARWYNPSLGQFQNADTVANAPSPFSVNANLYAYAGDSPLDYTDPTGHNQGPVDSSGIPVDVGGVIGVGITVGGPTGVPVTGPCTCGGSGIGPFNGEDLNNDLNDSDTGPIGSPAPTWTGYSEPPPAWDGTGSPAPTWTGYNPPAPAGGRQRLAAAVLRWADPAAPGSPHRRRAPAVPAVPGTQGRRKTGRAGTPAPHQRT
jgi:RHS repeat-associated protein